MKELVNVFEGQFECLGENTEKYKTFYVSIEKETRLVVKDSNDDTITIFTRQNLLRVQDLWQVHYLILSIILQKEFTKLNVNADLGIKAFQTRIMKS